MVRYMADSVDCTQFTQHVQVPGKGLQVVSLTAGYLPPSRYAVDSQKCGGTDVKIDVAGIHPEADVLDIEQGDATPDTAPEWVKNHNSVHPAYPGILYCNRSTITAVANALQAANLQVVRDYHWWIATLDGTETVADMTGVTAVQVWGASHFPDNIDLSIVYDDAWKAAPKPPPPPPPVPRIPVYYRIKSGDNLTVIGRQFGVSVEQLVAWNRIADPNVIFPGTLLIVGWKTMRVPVYYWVVSGDTLTAIADAYHTTVSQLQAWNHIVNPNVIYPHEVLIVGYH